MITKRRSILGKILKNTHIDKILLGFIAYFLLTCLFLTIIEPSIQHFDDAVWFCFAVVSTIGFGDITAVTIAGRIATMILAMYGVLIFALVPGIVTSYYLETVKSTANKHKQSIIDHQLP